MTHKDIVEGLRKLKPKISMKEITANQFPKMYEELGINLSKLGCIMIDVDGSAIQNIIPESDLYTSSSPERFWIKGFVAGHTPHITLLYGLLKSGAKEYKKYVDEVLKGWVINSVQIDHIGFFDSPFTDDPYYCIVAHVLISNELTDANQRLQLLPHINTFPGYKAHLTIAYVKKDEALRDKLIADYNKMLQGKMMATKELNYGK